MPSNRLPEMLEAGAIYSSREFKARLRLGQAGWRKMKREGLKTYQAGKTVLVTTSDFQDFLQSREGKPP